MAEIPTKTQQGDSCLYGYINLLLDNELIKKEDISLLKNRNKTCEDLLDYLNNIGVLDEKKLTTLYAKAKGVPYVDIKSIDRRAYDLIDRNVAKEYSFIPFSISEKSKTLQIAIADFSKLSRISQRYLAVLERRLGYKIEIFVTTKSALSDLPALLSDDLEFPEVNLESFFIDEKVLKKIPIDLASKYRMIIFRQVSEGEYNVAVADPSDKKMVTMLEEMQKRTRIKFHIFVAPRNQMDRIIADYRMKEEVEARRDQEDKRNRIGAKKDLMGKTNFNEENDSAESDESSVASMDKSEPDVLDDQNNFTMEQPSAGENKNDSIRQENRFENPDLTSIIGSDKPSVDMINKVASQGNIPQLIALIMALAIEGEASDIHIEPFEKNTRLRFRVDGVLSDIAQLPVSLQSQIVARIKILSKLKLDEQRVPQDGRFDAKFSKDIVDLRVSTLPTVFGEKVVMRILSKTKRMEDLSDLGLEGLNYDRVIEAISKPYGVILATGPTGSGKSTTLYSIFSRLNKPETNIITLEDPVEYEIQGINQVQVKPQIGFGFADGLRSVLRQDPNIIMVGEIRDGETAELVVQAALTGHLVFSTLHTNDASSALPRMYNLGVEPFLLTSAINAVIAQRLVRRICPKCKKEVQVPQSVAFQVKKELEALNLNMPIKFYKGEGCAQCKDGFKGRLGIYEVLKMSGEMEDMVLDKKSSQDIFTQATKEGMITMKQDGLIKAVKGMTTVDEVLRVTREQNEEGP